MLKYLLFFLSLMLCLMSGSSLTQVEDGARRKYSCRSFSP